jgi:metal-responsive CopG/Arc/MetJ family transcriptional regulator
VLIGLEGGLLRKIDALAKKRKVSRSQLLADAARAIVAA